ncbi:hypothetical protein LQ954_13845 [Sphingomonas sp. IC-11]|uniref:hypothetical protein n=1 Tax=Sphingomonas sp. IC-11 TaxID=2898528 RepID=UPI001E5A2199|nr:hypothetical protein [Sphingomonas sp. IC-11]MCD2317225.1 hypothetical protein [Sphingomonas sp. IC-11]
MRFGSARLSAVTHAAALGLGAMLAWVALPLWREGVMRVNQRSYGLLVEQCDGAMRDHYQAKMRASDEPSRETGLALEAGEVGLIVCQDYDIYQKRLMQADDGEDPAGIARQVDPIDRGSVPFVEAALQDKQPDERLA